MLVSRLLKLDFFKKFSVLAGLEADDKRVTVFIVCISVCLPRK